MGKIRQVDAQDNHKNIYSCEHQVTFNSTKLGGHSRCNPLLPNLGHKHYMHIGR